MLSEVVNFGGKYMNLLHKINFKKLHNSRFG